MKRIPINESLIQRQRELMGEQRHINANAHLLPLLKAENKMAAGLNERIERMANSWNEPRSQSISLPVKGPAEGADDIPRPTNVVTEASELRRKADFNVHIQ